jgi:3-hydroxybutyryl-CoA dehydrogenase
MKIAATGTRNRLKELRSKVSSNLEIIEVKNKNFQGFDVVFDLNFDDGATSIEPYASLENTVVIVGAVKRQLEAAVGEYQGAIKCDVYGLNTIPTFLDRDKLEMTSLQNQNKPRIEKIMNDLGLSVTWVQSRLGMVTPRVVCMIINEAFYTLQEGTATKEDIDTGMKLGTAYPFGPFEWAERIGIVNVYEILRALYQDTGEGRYKVCPALKTVYLKEKENTF